jgi:hypothetical protein
MGQHIIRTKTSFKSAAIKIIKQDWPRLRKETERKRRNTSAT